MSIIMANKTHLDQIEALYLAAFPAEEAQDVATLMRDLTFQDSTPETLCIAYESEGKVVGAAGLSPVFFEENCEVSAYILAPLAILPRCQKQGIARKIIEYSKQYLTQNGVHVLLVYGDPAHYGRYGFEANLGEKFKPPYPLEFPFGWQAVMLNNTQLPKDHYNFRCSPALANEVYW